MFCELNRDVNLNGCELSQEITVPHSVMVSKVINMLASKKATSFEQVMAKLIKVLLLNRPKLDKLSVILCKRR